MFRYFKEILKISWPIIIGQLGMVLTGFFDNLMVSKLGYTSLAASGICNSVFFLIAIFPMGITMAFATVVGILKAKKRTIYSLLARDSAIITLVMSFIFSALLLLAVRYFNIFGQSEAVNQLAISYLTLLTISLFPMLVFFLAKNFCDGFGYTKAGMILTLIALLINILFNWVFIYGHLGSPAFGLDGAGYATILSRVFLAATMIVVMFRSNKIPVNLRAFLQSFKALHKTTFFLKILKIGIPTGLQYFFEIAAFATAAIIAGWFGAQSLAAHNLAITLASLSYMFASGLSAGGSILVATAFGSAQWQRVLLLGKSTHILSIIVMGSFGLLFLIFNTHLAKQFTAEPTVLALGSTLLIFTAIFQLSDGLQAVSVGLLRGMSDVNIPTYVTFGAYWLIAMPVGYYLAHYGAADSFWYGVVGIWLGLTVGLTLSATILTMRFYKKIKQHKESETPAFF